MAFPRTTRALVADLIEASATAAGGTSAIRTFLAVTVPAFVTVSLNRTR
jgi:hypothetical protein